MRLREILERLRKDPSVLWSVIFLGAVSVGALAAPWIAPYGYETQDVRNLLSPPTGSHPMGTDTLGRDLLSRVLYGARVSLAIGILSSLVALVIGTLYGATSGFLGGRVDNWMMRSVDVVYSLPDILLIILMSLVIGRGFWGIFLAISLFSWMTVARLMRGEVLRLREMTYVESARATGVGEWRVLWRHVLPNALGPLIVTWTFRIPSAILAESTLSFIGLGLAPPYSSWGVLANDGWNAIRFYPHLIVFPSLCLFLTVLAFNYMGNGLQKALDPGRSHAS